MICNEDRRLAAIWWGNPRRRNSLLFAGDAYTDGNDWSIHAAARSARRAVDRLIDRLNDRLSKSVL